MQSGLMGELLSKTSTGGASMDSKEAGLRWGQTDGQFPPLDLMGDLTIEVKAGGWGLTAGL